MIQPAGTVLSERDAAGSNSAMARPDGASRTRSESTDDHFKPDFKKGKK